MNQELNNDEEMRKYLLGEMSEEGQQALEERLMTEEELFELLHVAEDELIEDYLSSALSTDSRSRFEDFFLSSADRRAKLNFAKALKRYVTGEGATVEASSAETAPRDIARRLAVARSPSWSWKRAFSDPYLGVAAAMVITLGLGVGVWRAFFYQSEVAKGIAALSRAYRAERPVEARISQLGYAPLANTRGTESAKVDSLSLNRAERILLDEVSEHPTSAAYHALGRLYLAERKFDEAIAQFQDALKVDPNDAQLNSDLGAALLEEGKMDRSSDDPGKGLEEIAKSLERVYKALEVDGSLVEALFNRALAHQEMGLPEQAEEDWRKYLEKDSNSRWADEARKNLKSLEDSRKRTSQSKEEIFQDFLSAYEARDDERAWQVISRSREALSRRLIWEQLLDAFLEASTKRDDSDADRVLRALLYLGELEAQKAGDLYASSLARFYSGSAGAHVHALTRARQFMKSGLEYYAQGKPLKAIDLFSQARQMFASLGDQSEAQYAEQWLGSSHLEAGSTQRGISLLERVARSAEKKNFKWLLMRTLQSLSGAQYSIHRYSKGIDYGTRALALAKGTGDTVGTFNTLSLLSWLYKYIADYRQSLSCCELSLGLMDNSASNEIQIARHLHIVASALTSYGLHAAAIDYEREVLRRALIIDHPQLKSLAYSELGAMYGRAGRFRKALENTQLAYETAKSHVDQGVRAKIMAKASLLLGHLYRQAREFGKAIDSYDECLRLYRMMDLQYDVYQAHKGKLLCYLSQMNDPQAREELVITLNVFENYRSGIVGGEDKNRYFDIEQSIYDLAIDFEYSRANDSIKAFEYSEQSRARSLLDSVTGNAQVSYENGEPDVTSTSISQPLTLAETQRRLPDQMQILQYAVLTDKLLTWVVSKTGFSIAEIKITQQQLSDKVVDYLRLLSGSVEDQNEALRGSAKNLFDMLIRPSGPLLDRNKPVCIVPDKILNYLPFGALMSSDSGRFLIEDYRLIVSPSSTLSIISAEKSRTKEGTRVESLLSVGNPRFDRRAFPSLNYLSSAGREAEGVAAYYSSARILLGALAREDRVKSEMLRSDIIHFASHYVIDERSPMRSKLLLAGEGETPGEVQASDGVLEAHEIYRMKLPRTRVVVLSACQTGVEHYYQGEGMINMARPFMAAGVPLVIVSLWPVDSDSTAELMISFHKHRKRENVSTAEALRRAQLDMLNSSVERLRQPDCWAPFIAIGGCTNF